MIESNSSGVSATQVDDKIYDIQHFYAYGNCADFAAALHRRFCLPCVEFWTGEPVLGAGEMIHAAVLAEGATVEDGRFVDVFGEVTLEDIRQRYCECDLTVVERPVRELMFDPLGPDEGEVDNDLDALIASGVIKPAPRLTPRLR